MHLSTPEQTYPRKPVYVETKNEAGDPLLFQGHITYRHGDQCAVQAADTEQWYRVPVDQVHPLQ